LLTSLPIFALFVFGMCSLSFSEEVKKPKGGNDVDNSKIEEKQGAVRQLLLQENVVPLRRAVPNEQRDWIESWVFSGQTASAARAQLENAAAQRISLVKSKCQLDEVQLDKIELAANGDIARFFREVNSLRDEFKGMQPNRDNMNEVAKRVAPVQQTWNRGMATSQSLFVGVLKSVLTPEQRSRVSEERDSQLQERRRFQLMNFIKNVEKTIPFSAMQREQLMNSVGGFMLSSANNSLNESYLAYVAATKIEPETLSEFLDSPQIEAFKKLQDHWRKNLPQFEQIQRVRRQPNTEDWLDAIR
jgi:hypothetical protein